MSSNTSDVFVIDINKVNPGDIVLSTVPDSRVSAVIRKVTNSDFSHASIAMVGSNCIEAVSNGVRIMSLERVHIVDIKNIRVLRLKASFDPSLPAKAAGIAKGCLFRPYWMQGAVAAGIGRPKFQSIDHRFFCSHLVAYCYLEAGLNLLNGKHPGTVVPGDFVNFKTIFDDVTHEVFIASSKKDAPRHALDIEGYPANFENAFVSLNQKISRDLDLQFKNEKWFSPFRTKLHQFSEWYAFYFFYKSPDVLEKYDVGLVESLRKYGFSDFLTLEIPRHHPWVFITTEQWKFLFDSVSLSLSEIATQIDIQVALEKSYQLNIDIFKEDLKIAEDMLLMSPALWSYQGVQLLHNFYVSRVSIAEKIIETIQGKIVILNQRLLS